MLDHCIKREIDEAIAIVMKLYKLGYASEDIIQNIFRVAKNHTAAEYIKERVFFCVFQLTVEFHSEGLHAYDFLLNNYKMIPVYYQ